MADQANVSIAIGGAIKRRDIGRLAEAIEELTLGKDWDQPATATEARALMKGAAAGAVPLRLKARLSGGTADEVETLCRELGLSYARGDDGHYTWSATVVYWTPALPAEREWLGQQENYIPHLSASQIGAHLAAGTLAEELATMKAAGNFSVPFSITN